MERYGWDKLKSEGLQELEKIASANFFAGKDEIISLIRKYIELYKNDADLKNQIQGTIFYPAIAKRNEKAARDKSYYQAKKLRRLLPEFYDSDEGKTSQYRIFFISDERDYRLGIKELAESSETKEDKKNLADAAEPPTRVTDNSLSVFKRVKDGALDFLKIYAEAIAIPKGLVNRSSASETFNWDTVGVFIFSALLVASISHQYFDSFRDYTELMNIHPDDKHYLLNALSIIKRPFYTLISFKLLFAIFRFAMFAAIVPWVIYNKIFKGTATIYSLINFHFYFIMSWVPIAVWVGFIAIDRTIHRMGIDVVGFIALLIGCWVLWLYYYRLYKLSGFTWKKGILPSIIYFVAHYLSLKTF